MTKIFNFALKIKEVVGRVADAKYSYPATPQNLERAPEQRHFTDQKDMDTV